MIEHGATKEKEAEAIVNTNRLIEEYNQFTGGEIPIERTMVTAEHKGKFAEEIHK